MQGRADNGQFAEINAILRNFVREEVRKLVIARQKNKIPVKSDKRGRDAYIITNSLFTANQDYVSVALQFEYQLNSSSSPIPCAFYTKSLNFTVNPLKRLTLEELLGSKNAAERILSMTTRTRREASLSAYKSERSKAARIENFSFDANGLHIYLSADDASGFGWGAGILDSVDLSRDSVKEILPQNSRLRHFWK